MSAQRNPGNAHFASTFLPEIIYKVTISPGNNNELTGDQRFIKRSLVNLCSRSACRFSTNKRKGWNRKDAEGGDYLGITAYDLTSLLHYTSTDSFREILRDRCSLILLSCK